MHKILKYALWVQAFLLSTVFATTGYADQDVQTPQRWRIENRRYRIANSFRVDRFFSPDRDKLAVPFWLGRLVAMPAWSRSCYGECVVFARRANSVVLGGQHWNRKALRFQSEDTYKRITNQSIEDKYDPQGFANYTGLFTRLNKNELRDDSGTLILTLPMRNISHAVLLHWTDQRFYFYNPSVFGGLYSYSDKKILAKAFAGYVKAFCDLDSGGEFILENWGFLAKDVAPTA